MSIQISRGSSDTLVIGITGYGKGFGMDINEFYQQAGLSTYSRITMTDPSRRFFFSGLGPDLPGFMDVLSALEEAVADIAPRRLFVTGSSAGGHSALLLGHLLFAHDVVAFAPFTYLCETTARSLGDDGIARTYERRRFRDEVERLGSDISSYLDLRAVLSNWNGTSRYSLHVADERKWDVRRARYLEGTPHLNVYGHPYASHTIARSLAKDGALQGCFRSPYRYARNWRYIRRRVMKGLSFGRVRQANANGSLPARHFEIAENGSNK